MTRTLRARPLGRPLGALALLAAVAAPLLARNAYPYANLDDAFYLQFGGAIARGEVPYRDFVLPQLPGAEVLLALLRLLAGPGLGPPRALTAAAVWATAYLLRRTGRALGGPRVGAAAALLWAWAPAVVAHHVFEREILTALLLAAGLAVETSGGRGGRPGAGRDAAWIALAAAGFLVKATFGLAVVGVAAGLAATDGRRAARVLVGGTAACLAVLLGLVAVLGPGVLLQAVLFQACKGSLPAAERAAAFATAAGPWAVAAIAGAAVLPWTHPMAAATRMSPSAPRPDERDRRSRGKGATVADRRWAVPAALALATSVPLVALGPTFWSHNAIDAMVPFSLLGGLAVARASDAGLPARFARLALGAAAALLLFLLAAGRLVFLTEGVPLDDLRRVASEVGRRTGPGERVFAPSAVLAEADRPGLVVHPEYLGVYRRILVTLSERGLGAALREAAGRPFLEAPRLERGRWEPEAYAAIAAGRARIVVLPADPAYAGEERLDPARLAAAGLAPVLRTGTYVVWAR